MESTARKCGDRVVSTVTLRGFVVATTVKACMLVPAVRRIGFSVVPVSTSWNNWVLGSGTCYCPTRHVPCIVICRTLV